VYRLGVDPLGMRHLGRPGQTKHSHKPAASNEIRRAKLPSLHTRNLLQGPLASKDHCSRDVAAISTAQPLISRSTAGQPRFADQSSTTHG
jgi:hypothetical protein